MDEGQLERIQEGVYFLVDISSFQTTVVGYDPLLASQTILFSWGVPEAEEPELSPVELQGIGREPGVVSQ